MEYNYGMLINGNVVVLQIRKADTFLKRLLGWMFRSRPPEDGLLLTPCNSIHTFFMRFPIDAVFMNKECRVLKVVPNLKPNKIVAPVKDAVQALELMDGFTERMRIKEGDLLQLD